MNPSAASNLYWTLIPGEIPTFLEADWAQRPPIFDIGAHEGKVSSVLRPFAPVYAFEPQATFTEPMQGVEVIRCAISDRCGVGTLLIDPDHDYLSTLSFDYTRKVRHAHSADYHTRTVPIKVPTLTLDSLIETIGVPAFVKVDVEGHERAVFRGLSYPVPALSFEVHDFDLDKAAEIMDMLGELGDYSYAYSRREDFQLEDIGQLFAKPDLFGDVYATLGGPLL